MKGEGSRPDLALAGIGIGTVIALGVGSIPLLDGGGPSLDPDWLRGVGLIAILMIPVALALVGLRRPGALLAAGVVSLPMCFMSFSFLLFPLLIPAALYLIAYGRAAIEYTPRLAPAAVASLTFVLVVLSFMALFMHEDPRCYEIVRRPNGSTFDRPLPPGESVYSAQGGRGVVGSGCSSDSVTPIEAGTSLGLVTLAALAATYLSGPRRSQQASLDVYA